MNGAPNPYTLAGFSERTLPDSFTSEATDGESIVIWVSLNANVGIGLLAAAADRLAQVVLTIMAQALRVQLRTSQSGCSVNSDLVH